MLRHTGWLRVLSVVAAWAGLASVALAQGVLVNVEPGVTLRLPRPIIVQPPQPQPRPIPVATYKVQEVEVNARITEQVARVQLTQSFVNTGSATMEVCFIFPLPYDGAIDQMTLMVDGKEYPAKLLTKEEARRTYENIVRKNQDPALLEWVGHGMFQTSVFPVPAGAMRKVSLRYSQVCRKDRGLTEFVLPLSTARYTSTPLEKLSVQVNIESKTEIKNVYSPTHAVDVTRNPYSATVKFVSQQHLPDGDFRLFYDVGAGQLGAGVLSYRPAGEDDGYFLLLASPQIQSDPSARTAKTVVFVIDRSGSMSGEKIEQAKGALKFLLNNLREGDLFNVVVYDTAVESFRPELEKYSDTARQQALGFVEGIYAGGSTNISGALATALAQLKDPSRPSYVLFLTDGLPTAGETNEAKIVADTKGLNSVRARVIVCGVGYDVNSRLLDKLARANFGQSEYVRPNENIEEKVGRVYQRIESPVLTDLAVSFALDQLLAADGSAVNRVYPKDSFDLFEGEQLVLVGRYRKPGAAKVTISGKVRGEPKSFDFPADLAANSPDETYAFIARLWASRRIGEIIDQIDLSGRNEELVKELVELSSRYGILTPYTTFLADETMRASDLAVRTSTANFHLDLLEQAAGESGVAQRVGKRMLQDGASALGAVPARPSGGGQADELHVLARGAAVVQDALEDKFVVVESCRNIGAKTFFLREAKWVDSSVNEDMEKDAKRVEQFSDEYFELAARHGKKLGQYLVFDEAICINLEGQAYWIEPPAM